MFQVGGVASLLTMLTNHRRANSDRGGGLANIGGTTTLTDCTVSGNSAGIDGGGLIELRRHDHADQLHRQRQLRRLTAAACSTTAARPR